MISRRASVFVWVVALLVVLSLGLAFAMSANQGYNALIGTVTANAATQNAFDLTYGIPTSHP